MKDVFVLLNNNIRELFRQTSFWIGVIIVLQVLMIWLIIYVYLELSDSNYHFYMNTKQVWKVYTMSRLINMTAVLSVSCLQKKN